MKAKCKTAGRPSRMFTLDGKTQSLKEWAAQYGVNYGTLYKRVRSGRSLRESLAPDCMPIAGDLRSAYRKWMGAKLAKLLDMWKSNCTLQEMGEHFGVTRERIRQVLNNHSLRSRAMEPPYGYSSISAVAKALGDSSMRIQTLVKESDGAIIRGRYTWIPNSLVPILDERHARRRDRKCKKCGAEFRAGKRDGNRQYCSKACVPTMVERSRNPPKGATLAWHRDFLSASRERLHEDEWMTINSVCGLGLTKMQIIWLVRKGVLRTLPHPTEQWRGRPVLQYSRQEVELAGDIYQQHKRTGTHRDPV